MKRVSIYLLLALTLLSTSNCTRINATEKGFKFTNSGSEKGTIEAIPAFGYVGYIPGYTKVVAFPTQLQHYVWTNDPKEGSADDQHIEIPCKGGPVVAVNVGLNYTVNADSVIKIYKKFSTDDMDWITKNYLRLMVRNAMVEVSGTQTLDSLMNAVPNFEDAVRKRIAVAMEKDGFHLETFGLTHAPLPVDKALRDAISVKNSEKQLADQAIYTRIKNENLAAANTAKARGDSAVNIINALSEAKGIAVKQAVVTPTYVEYIKWLNAGPEVPRVPATSLGYGSNVLLNK